MEKELESTFQDELRTEREMTETENNWIPRHDLICRVRIPIEAYQHIGCYQGQKIKQHYYVESVGHISEDTIKRYIQEQKGKCC